MIARAIATFSAERPIEREVFFDFLITSCICSLVSCRHLLALQNLFIFNDYRNIERQRQWYLSDNETRKRYMTWQQELDDMVYEERERTKAAEKRANEEKCRADEAVNLANKEKSRADKYEKMLKEHGLL